MKYITLLLLVLGFHQAQAITVSCANNGVKVVFDSGYKRIEMQKLSKKNIYVISNASDIKSLTTKKLSGQEKVELQASNGWKVETMFPKKGIRGWGTLYDKKTKKLYDLGVCDKAAFIND